MKVSYSWLREFVQIAETPQQLGDRFTSVGLAVDSLTKVGDDAVFELDVATNRPDCLSHLGVAREIAAIYGSELKPPKYQLHEVERQAQDIFSISILDSDLCARYCGRYIAGVKIGPSPQWLIDRLDRLGVRSINNVADITNYVMLELGQPLHAFDADTLARRQIVVRRAQVEERIRTLDGTERELNPSMLVIADAERAVAIAGVMGGAETEISSKTTNVLLESATFDSVSIRKTSRSLGLSTEASYRFERGADIEMARFACERTAALIQELAGGTVYRDVIDVYPRRRTRLIATLRRKRIKTFLGAPVDDSVVDRILIRLGFDTKHTHDGWSVEVPSYRLDISREEDLLEEIARQHGFDKFPSTLPQWSGAGSALPFETAERLLRNRLAAAGYSETIPMAFSDEATERKFRPNVRPIELMNPMAEDEAILRTSLIPSMLRTIQWNVNRETRDLQLYELGKVYKHDGESRTLILAVTGLLRTKSVHDSEREVNFFDLKGHVDDLLEFFNVTFQADSKSLPSYYHPGRSVRVGDVVVFGEIHPDYVREYKLKNRVYLAEFDADLLLESVGPASIRPVSRFPSIRRDFSLVLNRTTHYADVERTVRAANVPELIRVDPFDRLESDSFGQSRYALAISVTYQSPERTLTDDEVDNFDKRILALLRTQLGAELRQ